MKPSSFRYFARLRTLACLVLPGILLLACGLWRSKPRLPDEVVQYSISDPNAQQFTIRGTVTDEASGEPLPFATVVIGEYPGHVLMGSTSDFDGSYAIVSQDYSPPGDTLIITFKRIPYSPFSMKVRRGGIHRLDVQLKEQQARLYLEETALPAGPR